MDLELRLFYQIKILEFNLGASAAVWGILGHYFELTVAVDTRLGPQKCSNQPCLN